jgi:hypothetical protein
MLQNSFIVGVKEDSKKRTFFECGYFNSEGVSENLRNQVLADSPLTSSRFYDLSILLREISIHYKEKSFNGQVQVYLVPDNQHVPNGLFSSISPIFTIDGSQVEEGINYLIPPRTLDSLRMELSDYVKP